MQVCGWRGAYITGYSKKFEEPGEFAAGKLPSITPQSDDIIAMCNVGRIGPQK